MLAKLNISVAAKAGVGARQAKAEIRTCHVTLDLRFGSSSNRAATVDAVLVSEVDPPRNVPKLEWLLLTSFSVDSPADAKFVVDGYAQRWRIEEFHRVWKSGACNVERTQLRDVDRIQVWATFLVSVAQSHGSPISEDTLGNLQADHRVLSSSAAVSNNSMRWFMWQPRCRERRCDQC